MQLASEFQVERMRIRTVKPEFFKHEELYDAEQETGLPLRVAFEGLWCAADREGRFQWRPRTLKTDILPHDDLDFSRVLDALTTRGFLVRYASRGREYGWIPSFKVHQVTNNRERDSELPPPPPDLVTAWEDGTLTRAPRVEDACPTREGNARACTSGREGKGREGEQGPTTTTTARARLREQLTTEGQDAFDGLIKASAQPEALVGECTMILAGERQIKPKPTPEGLSLALCDLRTNNTRPTARSVRTYTADAMRQLTEGISTSRERSDATAWDKVMTEAKEREEANAH